MADFFGRWSCSEAPLSSAGDAINAWSALALFAASMDALSGSTFTPPKRTREELRTDRFWLSAPTASLVRADGVTQAYVGFLTKPLDVRGVPEGHAALVRHDGHQISLWRNLSGGERLVYIRIAGEVWFASSLKLLLKHPQVAFRIDPAMLAEVLLTGRTCFGDRTLVADVREVMAGQVVHFAPEPTAPRSFYEQAIRMPQGAPESLADQMFDNLTEAVVSAAGSTRPVAVALSGGIDSSAVIASAVEAFGADQVTALTYEFDDVDHPVETDFARQVCAHLGIEDHRIFKLSKRGFFDRIPEMIWRSESLVNWPKTFMLEVAEEVERQGFDRYLTGFGFGSHMDWMREVADALAWLPSSLLRSYWRWGRFEVGGMYRGLYRIHPALEPPHPRVYHFMVRLLHQAGVFADLRGAYPEALHPLVEAMEPLESLEPGLLEMEPVARFQHVACSHMLSCIDVSRTERPSREVGAYRVAPGHFSAVLPYAYFPPASKVGLSAEEKRLRPGKYLLRAAYRERLPDTVIYRIKSWADAVASDTWVQHARREMCIRQVNFPGAFSRFGEDWRSAVCHWEPHSILATCLGYQAWENLITSPELPTWETLSLLSAA